MYNKKRESAYSRKISSIIDGKQIKFIGKSSDNLKAEFNVMPNFRVVVF